MGVGKQSDGKICLKGASKKYISAQPEGTVSCDKDEVGNWEKFEWLTVYTNPEPKGKSMRSNGYNGQRERSGSTSSSSSSMSSTSGSLVHNSKNIFRSRTLGLKPAGEPVHFRPV
eukprot:TRINITY_DN4945_c0_g1_i1.p1 TRINITY_DN4945_c0_g1~~TRINITY_DN4945_c0_g1_i1.p1  ORF type:complete len:115 (-),score=27.46 TRINITY_DN4945_c0_g1_i1:70-414(-)